MAFKLYEAKVKVQGPDNLLTEEQELSDLCDRISDAVSEAIEDVKTTLAEDITKHSIEVELVEDEA